MNKISPLLITFASIPLISLPVYSLSESTTVERVTVTPKGQVITLPVSGSYVLIDPISGAVKGDYVTEQTTEETTTTIEPGTVVAEKSTGRLVALLNPSGELVDVRTTPAYDPLVASIDKRRGELNRQITTALTDGKITEQQAKILRDELDKVGKRQADDTSFGKLLSYSESIYLASALNDVADHFAFLAHENAMQPLISSRIVNNGNSMAIMLDDFDYQKAKLRSHIDDEYIAGKLMFPESQSLKKQIDAISDQENEYRKNGALTAEQKTTLTDQLDAVKADIDRRVSGK